MRSSLVPVVVLAVLIGAPWSATAQPDVDSDSQKPASQTPRATTNIDPPPPSPASRRNLSNVQIEITISDQIGSGPMQKKTVSMIAASGTWGKIRAAGTARPNERSGVVPVGLNVDARPFLMPDGVVQVELTLLYNPLDPLSAERNEPSGQVRPTELNQSLTVVLQNGKSLVVSQAADPVSDRKIIVEVKATVLK